MTLSLDSNVLIDIVNGHGLVRARYAEARLAGRAMTASVVAAHELLFGAAISTRPALQTKSAAELLGALTMADFTMQDAMTAADLRGRLRQKGQPIGGFDMLIAGQALGRGWTVVTANTRDFVRVEGLQLENWALPVG